MTTVDAHSANSLPRMLVGAFLGLCFGLVAFGVVTSPIDIYTILRFTDFENILNPHAFSMTQRIITFFFVMFLSAFALDVIVSLIDHKKTSLIPFLNYTSNMAMRTSQHGLRNIRRSLYRTYFVFFSTLFMLFIFHRVGIGTSVFTMFTSPTNIPTHTEILSLHSAMALILAVYFLTWGFVPPRFFDILSR